MEADPPAGVITRQKGPWKTSGCAFPGAAGGGADATRPGALGEAGAGDPGFVAGDPPSEASGAAGEDGSFTAGDAGSFAAGAYGSFVATAESLPAGTSTLPPMAASPSR